MGAVHERQLVGHDDFAEHTKHIQQPELRQLDQRLEHNLAQHLRLIERGRWHERQLVRHEHPAQHVEQPELWLLQRCELDLAQHHRQLRSQDARGGHDVGVRLPS